MSTYETRQVVRDLVRSYMKTSNVSSSSSPAPSPTLLSNLMNQARKGDIRYIQDDPLMRREKFDGSCWRLVCTWAVVRCTNFAYSRNLCTRHNAESQNKPVNKRQRRVHIERNRPTPISEPDRGPVFLYSPISPVSSPDKQTNDGGCDDDDVQIVAEVYPNPSTDRLPSASIKRENSHYVQFSIDSPNFPNEPALRTSNQFLPSSSKDVEFLGLKANLHPLNVIDSLNKKVPPLTEFEEEYLSTAMIQTLPLNCSLIDAQLFLHNTAMNLVQKNYRMKMDTITPEYFYDFLLRHPRVSLHFQHWFNRCKPCLPTSGCPIDTKLWTISMMILGSASLHQADEAT